ncbi:MAG: amidohydrolase [Bacteroidota bacterium]
MQDLSLTLIQSDLHWQNVDANLAMFEEKIWQIDQPTDLIVLPEMFNTGFTMDTKAVSEPMNSKTFRWMKQQASQSKAVVMGSFIVYDAGSYYNRLIWMRPDGEYAYYDKRHLFRMADEHNYFASGESVLVQEWKGWRICPQVCYDLRFPVWARNRFLEDQKRMNYDLIVYIANWPAARSTAWDILLRARGVENLAYSVGVNRVGEDGNGIAYNGHSAAIDPKGNELCFEADDEMITTVALSADELLRYREKFPAYLDADQFEVK